jgi:hypothetical protein
VGRSIATKMNYYAVSEPTWLVSLLKKTTDGKRSSLGDGVLILRLVAKHPVGWSVSLTKGSLGFESYCPSIKKQVKQLCASPAFSFN